MKWIKSSEQTPPKDGKPFLCYDPSQKNNFKHATIYVVRWISGTQFWKNASHHALPLPPSLPFAGPSNNSKVKNDS
jgi:hypothetical protein